MRSVSGLGGRGFVHTPSALNATKTDNARWACFPNTFLKNRDATVTPDSMISSLVAALRGATVNALNSVREVAIHVREVCNVGEEVENRGNAKSKRAGDPECSDGILDLVHDLVDGGPARVRAEDFEHDCGILGAVSVPGPDNVRVTNARTSFPLCELPAKAFLKFL